MGKSVHPQTEMAMVGENVLLRIYMHSADMYHFAPAYERVIQQAEKHKLAGITALRGIMGFGSRGIIQPSALRLSGDTPVILESVDDGEKIIAFLRDVAEKILHHGFVTMERAAVVMYRPREHAPRGQAKLMGQIRPLSTLPAIEGVLPMHTHSDGVLLRIFIGESDHYEKKPLYEAILVKARELGLSGATVLQGAMGFGANSVVHSDKILAMSSDLPIVIEFVDSREKIERLLPHLDQMVTEGMITMEDVKVIAYRHGADAGQK